MASRRIAFKEFLRNLDLFAGMPEFDLDRLTQMAVHVTVKKGDVLLEEGAPGGSLYVILVGEFEVTKRSGNGEVLLGVRTSGEVLGEMSLLDKTPRSATVRALQDGELLLIGHEAFQHVLACNPSAASSILHTNFTRLRDQQAKLIESEKMAGLGRLTAGLLHEINNPSAATQRNAALLSDTLEHWQQLADALDTLPLSALQRERISMLRSTIHERVQSPVTRDPLTRSDLEYQVQNWLEEHQVDNSWDLAPVLVEYGWEVEALDELSDVFGDEELDVIVPWLVTALSVHSLVEEIKMSTARISELVKAVKSYSYLDQAPVQNVDVHAGIDDTLIILRYKLKGGVEVVRDYQPDLPRIEGYGSELNQVWTNIIDNAIQAMDGKGTIHIRTYAQNDDVVVEITDSGPGIPEEIRGRIFEPFFTTKPQGVGTGLGLHTTYNVIVNKHGGKVAVTSKPGRTQFRVILPVTLARSKG